MRIASLRVIALVIIAGLFGGCANGPVEVESSPAETVEKAPSFEEGLSTCADGPEPLDWIQCLERVVRQFPLSPSSEGAALLLRSLDARYQIVKSSTNPSTYPECLKATVLWSFGYLRENKNAFSAPSPEIEACLIQELSSFADYLEDQGSLVVKRNFSKTSPLDARLERLEKKVSSRGFEHKTCAGWPEFRQEVLGLARLARYAQRSQIPRDLPDRIQSKADELLRREQALSKCESP